MTYQFEIIKVSWHHNRGHFIFARHWGHHHHFVVGDNALLDDVPIYHYTAMYPTTDDNGNPQFDLFVFRPILLNRLADNYFTPAQLVTLTTD